MRLFTILITAALAISPVVFAEDAFQLDVLNKPFDAQKVAVLRSVNSDEKYSEITNEKRSEVTKALERISLVLADGKSLSSVDASYQERILADQRIVNLVLEEARRDSRMVCAKEPVIGSNLPKRVCKTAAARNRDNAEVRRKNGTEIKL